MRRLGDVVLPALLLLAGAAILPASTSAQQLYDFGSAFGRAVAVVGGEVVVGEPQNVTRPGQAYVFAPRGGAWSRSALLEASDATRADGFGRALAATDDALLVGAPLAADGAGAAYLFVRDGEAWRESHRVEASEGARAAGSAVALAPGLAAVVEQGEEGERVRVFREEEGRLVEEAVLRGRDGDGRFGAALASPSGDLLAVCGADADGSAVVDLFRRSADGSWSRSTRMDTEVPLSARGGLLSQDPYKECGLSASGDRVAVGTPLGGGGAGSVTLARVDGGTLLRDTALTAPVAGTGGGLGTAISLGGGSLWAGVPRAQGLLGAALLVDLDAGGAPDPTVLRGPGQDFMPVFGLALAATDELAVVGSPGDAYGAGTAVIYRRGADGWAEAGVVTGEGEGYTAVTGEKVDCADGTAREFTCRSMDLVSLLPVQELGASRGAMVNDVWGWTDPETGREYAVVGRSEGTSFVDVTDPARPLYLGEMPKTEGSRGQAWRDVKVLNDHALVVADNAGEHGMQVFDLTRLRDADLAAPATFEPDALYTELASSHNLAVNEATGFAYAMASSGGGRGCGSLHMIDLRDPSDPTFAGCYNDPEVGLGAPGQTHDAQCVVYEGPDEGYRGREICFGFSENGITIGDVTEKSATEVISRARYPSSAYTHQGWLTEDQRYLYVNDELDEMNGLTERTRTLIWDVAELDDPVLVGEYLGETRATDHNLYVRGDLMYQSNYAAGLRLIDVSDPENPREVGYFDTAPYSEDLPGFFHGSWSNYPFFESGNILVTSHKQGLFVIRRRVPVS